MRIGSTLLLTALALVVLAHGGVLACGASDADGAGVPVAGSSGLAGSSVSAGAGGALVAGAGGGVSAGADGLAGGGASASGGAGASSAGAAGASAGAGGVSGGAGGASGSVGTGGAGGAAAFALTSPSLMMKAGCGTDNIAACDKFATDFLLPTIGGANHSPELDWTSGPTGTLSYAIVLYDESNKYTHWAIWNIPASTSKLPASLPAGPDPAGITGAKQISFYMSKNAYAGPGANSHVYQFKLYALKVATLSPNTTGNDAQIAVRMALEASADVLAKVELVGATPN